jgi:shikimate dehydrogenase
MTDKYAVIGNPIAQSKSPQIHAEFAKQCGQDMTYAALLAPVDGFNAAVDAFRADGGRGMNVTVPFKLNAYAYATELMERAKLAGAVNCLKFVGDRVLAENYDGVGMVNDIQANLGFPIRGRRVLLLGAGGAARGGVLPVLAQHAAELVIVNRTVAKAHVLKEMFSPYGAVASCGYADLGGRNFDIVLNATTASLHGELPPITAGIFAPDCLAYDLVYGKGLTPFLRLARDAGAARLADGAGMLVEQAAEAFLWWRGVRPSTRAMLDAISLPLA